MMAPRRDRSLTSHADRPSGKVAAPLGKDLVGLEHLSADQIRMILDTAEPFKEVSERPIKKVPALRGKTIVNLFFEASTRTRISFEFAEKRLSADTVNVASTGSLGEQGRDPGGHRPEPRSHADRHGGDPARLLRLRPVPGRPDPLQRDQRGRRQARAPDPGAARPADPARPVQAASRGSRSPSAATYCTAGWPEATSGDSPSSAPRWRCAARPPCCRGASNRSASR